MFGLGIRNVGEHLSRVFAKEFKDNFEKFIKADVEKLADIHEVGPTVAECVVRFWGNPDNRMAVEACFSAGVTLTKDIMSLDKLSFVGKTFVFTGYLEKVNRNKAKEMVEKF